MFQDLPHRLRLCDEPYQVHPPAAPAALERKYPIDAPATSHTNIAPHVTPAGRRQLCALSLAGVPCPPLPVSGLPEPSPLPATASSAPAPQSSGGDDCAAVVSTLLSSIENRWRSAASQQIFATQACAPATAVQQLSPAAYGFLRVCWKDLLAIYSVFIEYGSARNYLIRRRQ